MLSEEHVNERYFALGREVAAHVGIPLTAARAMDVQETATMFACLGIVLEKEEAQIQEDIADCVRFVHRENPSILAQYFETPA